MWAPLVTTLYQEKIVPMKALQWLYSVIDWSKQADLPITRILPLPVKKALFRRILAMHTSLSKDPIDLNGLSFYLPRSLVYSYTRRELEPETTEIFRGVLRPGMVLLDVGANIGYFSLLAAKSVGPQGKVYAVDPGENNLDYLRRNIEANNFNNVEVLPYAAGSGRRIREFYLRPVSTMNSLYASNSGTGTVSSVQEMPLDELIEGRVDFIKIDIEGGEIDALLGMSRILQSSPELRLIVEWNPLLLQKAGHEPSELPELLHSAGFALSVFGHHAQTWQKVEDVLDLLKTEPLRNSGWYTNLYAERTV